MNIFILYLLVIQFVWDERKYAHKYHRKYFLLPEGIFIKSIGLQGRNREKMGLNGDSKILRIEFISLSDQSISKLYIKRTFLIH